VGGAPRFLEKPRAIPGVVAENRQGAPDVTLLFQTMAEAASATAFGSNLMNPRHRPVSAKAGLEQGRRIAEGLRSFWD
jgi:hypothetical protein